MVISREHEFSADGKLGGVALKQRCNPIVGTMSEAEGRIPSASQPRHFLAPISQIHTTGGDIFKPSERQSTEDSSTSRTANSLLPNYTETQEELEQNIPQGIGQTVVNYSGTQQGTRCKPRWGARLQEEYWTRRQNVPHSHRDAENTRRHGKQLPSSTTGSQKPTPRNFQMCRFVMYYFKNQN